MDGVHYIDKDLLTELIGEVAEAAEAMVKMGGSIRPHLNWRRQSPFWRFADGSAGWLF